MRERKGKAPSPGDYIREELERRDWGQDDLARILGRSPSRVNELILGRQAVSPEIAAELAACLGGTPESWLQREIAYRLGSSDPDTADVRRRARLYGLAPIKELQKRGWIQSVGDPDAIEHELLRLFEIESLDDEPHLPGVARKTSPAAELTVTQRAWCFRVRQIARSILTSEYKPDRLAACARELRKAAAYSQETGKVPVILASYGIRFVVVEPLLGGKIDGIATWLDEISPVIGISIRYDRIDSFWHTVCHELSHVRHCDKLSVDTDIGDLSSPSLDVKPAMERRADAEACDTLIPTDELQSFIKRIGPIYSKERINQLANRLKIHPGIIVGQLQHRGEIGYASNREMLVKVRHIVTPVALTDGWGHTIDPRVFR